MGLLRSMAQRNPVWRNSVDNLGYSLVLRRHAASTNVFPVGAGTTTSFDSVSPAHLLHACANAVYDVCTVWLQNDAQMCKQDTQAIGSGTVQKLLGEKETCT